MNRSTLSSIPATAQNLLEINKWDTTAEIKYNTQQKQYYTDSDKPEGSLSAVTAHVLSRTEEDRSAHRAAIDQLAQEISKKNPELGENFRARFAARKIFGQPLTQGAINRFFEDSLPENMKSQGSVQGLFKDVQQGFSNVLPRFASAPVYHYQPISDRDEENDKQTLLESSPRSTRSTDSIRSNSSYGTTGSTQQEEQIKEPPLNSITELPESAYASYQDGNAKVPSRKTEEPQNLVDLLIQAKVNTDADATNKTDTKAPTKSTDSVPTVTPVTSRVLDSYNKRHSKK